MTLPAADTFFAIFGLHRCAAHIGPESSRRFRAVDGRRYVSTRATCGVCGTRVETCLLERSG